MKEQFQIIHRDPCLDLPKFRRVDRSFLKNKTEPFAIDNQGHMLTFQEFRVLSSSNRLDSVMRVELLLLEPGVMGGGGAQSEGPAAKDLNKVR
jgi:hypothetical protein